MSHSLVVGGTGMLYGVSLYEASRFDITTVIARNRDRLHRLVAEAEAGGQSINPMIVDYRDEATLKSSLNAAIRTFGRIEQVVAWIHSSGEMAHSVIGRAVGRSRYSARYFEIRGSAGANPLETSEKRRRQMNQLGNIVFREIVLGYVQEASGPRWLTHDEIVRGVIEALETDKPRHIVGIVEPWFESPR